MRVETEELHILKHILGIKVAKSQKGFATSQHKYNQTRKLDGQPIDILVEQNHGLEPYSGTLLHDPRSYHKPVSLCTLPSHDHAPRTCHFEYCLSHSHVSSSQGKDCSMLVMV